MAALQKKKIEISTCVTDFIDIEIKVNRQLYRKAKISEQAEIGERISQLTTYLEETLKKAYEQFKESQTEAEAEAEPKAKAKG